MNPSRAFMALLQPPAASSGPYAPFPRVYGVVSALSKLMPPALRVMMPARMLFVNQWHKVINLN
ncbi:hypothetical protein [Sodalis sp. dw_96]|uniref:hypothetical protein n=1 Tax=Sodalis sp. dw_96 TaxID=2719794 RepID=UPI001BD58D60|nr:hypothetical protein [Sodalis sp. dw_96]